ncbi:MAG: exopolysaccharide biosynthesis protein [Alphaproteobacteria bacterium]|nr:exopolysaccharide biosynthesis protein [Alphaproteobacteria bacterium]
MAAHPPENLEQVLDAIAEAGDGEDVSVADLLASVGGRSFGPTLLVPSLLIVSPISGIPGVPTIGGLTIAFIAGQMVIGRHHIWLPRFLLSRHVGRSKLRKALKTLRPAARLMDHLIKPRLCLLTSKPLSHAIAAICAAIALAMPPLELIPFASSAVAGAVALFGLALLAHDGLLVLFGIAVTGLSLYLGLGALL